MRTHFKWVRNLGAIITLVVAYGLIVVIGVTLAIGVYFFQIIVRIMNRR